MPSAANASATGTEMPSSSLTSRTAQSMASSPSRSSAAFTVEAGPTTIAPADSSASAIIKETSASSSTTRTLRPFKRPLPGFIVVVPPEAQLAPTTEGVNEQSGTRSNNAERADQLLDKGGRLYVLEFATVASVI